jgi:hypothetical protein
MAWDFTKKRDARPLPAPIQPTVAARLGLIRGCDASYPGSGGVDRRKATEVS